MDLWSRSSGDDKALVAGVRAAVGGFGDHGSVATGTGKKT